MTTIVTTAMLTTPKRLLRLQHPTGTTTLRQQPGSMGTTTLRQQTSSMATNPRLARRATTPMLIALSRL